MRRLLNEIREIWKPTLVVAFVAYFALNGVVNQAFGDPLTAGITIALVVTTWLYAIVLWRERQAHLHYSWTQALGVSAAILIVVSVIKLVVNAIASGSIWDIAIAAVSAIFFVWYGSWRVLSTVFGGKPQA